MLLKNICDIYYSRILEKYPEFSALEFVFFFLRMHNEFSRTAQKKKYCMENVQIRYVAKMDYTNCLVYTHRGRERSFSAEYWMCSERWRAAAYNWMRVSPSGAKITNNFCLFPFATPFAFGWNNSALAWTRGLQRRTVGTNDKVNCRQTCTFGEAT